MTYQPSLQILRAQPDDLDDILALLEEARQWLIHKGLGEQWPMPHPRTVFAGRIDRGEEYVARHEYQLAGVFSLLWDDPAVWGDRPHDAGYVHGLAVHRSAAGQGLGAVLLDAAGELIAQAGRHYLRLDCWAGNAGLCRYYDRLGFQARGTKHLGRGFVVQRYERSVVGIRPTPADYQ